MFSFVLQLEEEFVLGRENGRVYFIFLKVFKKEKEEREKKTKSEREKREAVQRPRDLQ